MAFTIISVKCNIFEIFTKGFMGQILLNDILMILLFSAAISISAFLLYKISVKNPDKRDTARKYLHIIACTSCTIAAALIHDLFLLAIITLLSLIPLLYLVFRKNFFGKGNNKSYGIIYFPIIFIVLIMAFYNQPDRWLIVAPMGFLAFSDGFAALIGMRYSKHFFQLTGDNKSILGTVAFIVVGLIWMIVIKFLGFQSHEPMLQYLVFASTVTLLAASAEIMGSYGMDNLFVPAIAAFAIWAYTNAPLPIDSYELAITVALFALAGFTALKMKMLNNSGAIMAALLGIVIHGFGNFSIWPLLAFFATSSLLGKFPKNATSDEKDGKPRDHIQVLSNGGIAMFLAMINCFFNDEKYQLLYLISVAVSTSDTWSSEIGMRLSKKALDIKTFKILPAGLSGCISMPGLLAAVAGAIMISLFSNSLIDGMMIGLFGFTGSLMDSLLGAMFQARYKGEKKQNFSDFGTDFPVSGYKWMTNDRVNILTNIIITSTAAWYLL